MAVVSHKYGFIFVKTGKTAGTAIEVSLSQICGAEDVLTPVQPKEPMHKPRNYKAVPGDFWNHMPAKKIRALIGAERFEMYHKFCVEREPVDKCLSQYAMLKRSPIP